MGVAAAAPARRALVWRGFWAAKAARRCSRMISRARARFLLGASELVVWVEGRAVVRVRAVVVRRTAFEICIVGFWGRSWCEVIFVSDA